MKPSEFIKQYVAEKAGELESGSLRIVDLKVEAIILLLDTLLDEVDEHGLIQIHKQRIPTL